MKYLRKFESYQEYKEYTTDTPYSFDTVFKITKDQLNDYVSDMIDEFDYIDYDIINSDYNSFDIEFYSNDSTEDLKSEFEWYKKTASENLKKQLLQSHSLKVTEEKFDEERNRIVVTVKPEGKK